MDTPDDKKMNRWDLADKLEQMAGNLAGKSGQRKGLEFVNDNNICGTCRHAHMMRREAQNVMMTYCQELSQLVPHDLIHCNKYRNITQLDLSQMSQMAVILDPRDLLKQGYL